MVERSPNLESESVSVWENESPMTLGLSDVDNRGQTERGIMTWEIFEKAGSVASCRCEPS